MGAACGHCRDMKKSIRHLATEILVQVEKTHSFAGQLLDEQMELSRLSGTADGRLLTHIVYGVLRFRGRLDWVLTKLYHGNWSTLEETTKNVLRVGLFQLQFSDRLPAFAVVNEAVNVAGKVRPGHSGLVNAVLRSYLRQEKRITPLPAAGHQARYIAVFHSHPLWLVKKFMETFGAEKAQDLCAANNEIPPLTLRVNTLKVSRNHLQEKLAAQGMPSVPTKFSPDGLILENNFEPLQKTGFFHEGYFRFQDEAAQLISFLVNPQNSQSVLDICAGTGGKTTHLAAITKDSGRITAADRDEKKLKQLQKDALRLGIKKIQTLAADFSKNLPDGLHQGFDCVLVDASCSGSGTLRRNPEIKWRTGAADLRYLVRQQKLILNSASGAVRAKGRLIYCTCSLMPEENEEVVNSFLSANDNFYLTPPTGIIQQFVDSKGYFHTYPHLHRMDGFFAAILQRK